MMWPMAGAMTLSEHLVGLSLVATPLQLAARTRSPLTTSASCSHSRSPGSSRSSSAGGSQDPRSRESAPASRSVRTVPREPACAHSGPLRAVDATRPARPPRVSVHRRKTMARGLRHRMADPGAVERLLPACSSRCSSSRGWRGSSTGAGRPAAGWRSSRAWAVASLPLLPVLLKYREVHETLGLTRTVAEIRDYSAVPASFLHAAPLMQFWREGAGRELRAVPLHGRDRRAARPRRPGLLVSTNTRNTPGPLATDRAPIVFYAAAALLMWVLALGPGGIGQEAASPYRPYSWLLWLPGFNGVRVSSRFAMLGTLVPRDDGEPGRGAPVTADSLLRPQGRPLAPTRGRSP